MREIPAVTYFDRYRGVFREERIYAAGFLFWMYNSRLGQAATELVLKRKAFSRFYGWLHRQGWSRRKIRTFLEDMEVDTEELLGPLEGFRTFNDFFTRRIDLSKRAVRREPHICIAPVDGKVLVYPALEAPETFRIKGNSFNLGTFVRDGRLVDRFSGGSLAVSRLSLRDYHHFHFPDGGTPGEAVPLPGSYHAGGSYGIRRPVPYFAENFRVFTVFESDHFGTILIAEVGALTVGSIRQQFRPGLPVAKGAHKGFFELGSTVVLLFEKNAIAFDEDLRRNTEGGFETYVRYGDSIGRAAGSAGTGRDIPGEK